MSEIDEILDYLRFEQEWQAMDAKDHKPKTKHEKDCGVCIKSRVLKEQAKSQLYKLLVSKLPEKKLTADNATGFYQYDMGYDKCREDVIEAINDLFGEEDKSGTGVYTDV